MCVCVHMYVCVCVYMYLYVRVYVVCTHICSCMSLYVCTYVYMCVHVYTYLYMCDVCIRTCMSFCVYVCMCICVSAVGVILCERSGQASCPVKQKTGWTDVGTFYLSHLSNADSAALLCPMQQARGQSLLRQTRTACFLSHEALGGVEPLREPQFLLCKFSDPACPPLERGWNEVTLWMAGSGGRHPVAVLPSFMLVQITLFPENRNSTSITFL